MKNCAKKIKSTAGSSILEVLIALLIAGIVITSVFKAYINQHKNWNIQEEITNIQQNARAAVDELSRNIRMAGHELPLGLPAIEAHNTNPDTIVINFVENACQVEIEHTMPLPSAEIRCDGHDVSCFQDGQWVYIFQPDSGGGEFFEITQVQTGSSHIQHNTMSLSRCYPSESIILALYRAKYFIDRSDTLHPNLMLELPGQNPVVFAENIVDLQFRYRMKNGVFVDVPVIEDDIRAVEVILIGRSDRPDPDFPENPYRNRTYQSMVNLRNMDL